MAAIRFSGKDNIFGLGIKKASTAIALNSVLTIDSTTGHLQPAVAASTQLAGVARELVASTDSDYATARNTYIDIPKPGDLYAIDCNTTITQAMVGDMFDLADANVVNNSAGGTVKHVRLVAIIQPTYTSAAKPSVGLFEFNPSVLFGVSST